MSSKVDEGLGHPTYLASIFVDGYLRDFLKGGILESACRNSKRTELDVEERYEQSEYR